MCCYRKWVERLLYCITPTYLLHKILGCSFWIYWMQHTVVFHGHMPPHPNDFWRILKLRKWNYQEQPLQMCSSSYYPLFPHRYYHYSKTFWTDLVTNIVQFICLIMLIPHNCRIPTWVALMLPVWPLLDLPEDDILQVKRVLNYACGWHTDPQDVLLGGQVAWVSDTVQITEVAGKDRGGYERVRRLLIRGCCGCGFKPGGVQGWTMADDLGYNCHLQYGKLIELFTSLVWVSK